MGPYVACFKSAEGQSKGQGGPGETGCSTEGIWQEEEPSPQSNRIWNQHWNHAIKAHTWGCTPEGDELNYIQCPIHVDSLTTILHFYVKILWPLIKLETPCLKIGWRVGVSTTRPLCFTDDRFMNEFASLWHHWVGFRFIPEYSQNKTCILVDEVDAESRRWKILSSDLDDGACNSEVPCDSMLIENSCSMSDVYNFTAT